MEERETPVARHCPEMCVPRFIVTIELRWHDRVLSNCGHRHKNLGHSLAPGRIVNPSLVRWVAHYSEL